MGTGTLKLFESNNGGNSLTCVPQFEEDRFMDLKMSLVADPDKSSEPKEYLVRINEDDTRLLIDYLTSVINLYEKKLTDENL